jgi:ATP-dependent metalloprotease FtsH
MFPLKNDENNNNNNDKNLRLMVLSASMLIGLFIYTMIKGDSTFNSASYLAGIGFLLVLMVIAFYLNKYKEKVRKKLPRNQFTQELDKAQEKANEQKETPIENSSITPITSSITFNDIAGISDVKEELEEIVDFLNNPKKYTKFGVSLPKGVLLVGPPGVGKTLIAKAVAGEANVPFFYQSGASFVHIYVGMGAKRVRELFSKAKSQAPAIIFIDEIDAVGKSRNGGNNDEREATLNELLTQMDGFDNQNGVIVIGATNKIDVLDEALLRAGRFDRRVFLSLPSLTDRVKILELYTNKKQCSFDIQKLAQETSGFSSAALATIINEALLNMIKREGSSVVEEDIEIAKQKVQYGKKQLNIMCVEQKEILALYQASKAFIGKIKVALFDEGILDDECLYPSKTQIENKIKIYLAGSVGLEVIKKESYAVFESELKKAKELANEMVEKYNMGKSTSEILDRLKNELQNELLENKEEVLKLQEIMLKDEIIVF